MPVIDDDNNDDAVHKYNKSSFKNHHSKSSSVYLLYLVHVVVRSSILLQVCVQKVNRKATHNPAMNIIHAIEFMFL